MHMSGKNMTYLHLPVMLDEIVQFFAAGAQRRRSAPWRFLDATLGLGGHTEGVLQAIAGAQALGLDRDGEALGLARERLKPFAGAVRFRQSAFAGCAEALDEFGWDFVDGVLLDAGVSSLQLDSAARGFSFLQDGPLDMRMDRRQGEGAATLVNTASVETLKEIISLYGEDPQAGRIAGAIAEARAKAPLESTAQLAAVVEKAYPPKWRAMSRNHPATRTFMALRMAVNDELGQLGMFLERIVPRLAPGGRLAIISFHSLEDRMVKHFLKTAAADCLCPPGLIVCACGHTASLRLLSKKALQPSPEERERNPRARSAKLRLAERTEKTFSPLEETAELLRTGQNTLLMGTAAYRKKR
jgi:16S rRNA (cytosine1402-N4)-methyltransferase